MDVDTNWCLYCGKKTEVKYFCTILYFNNIIKKKIKDINSFFISIKYNYINRVLFIAQSIVII